MALTIAGFDPSSGAGITADLSVFAAHGIFGTSAITATTVQSTLGVAAVRAADPAWLQRTLEFVSTDLPAAGVKVGMVATDPIVRTIVEFLQTAQGIPYDPKAPENKNSALVWHYGGEAPKGAERNYLFGRTLSTCAESSPRSSRVGGISFVTCESRVAAGVSASKGTRPVSIS